jgi:hypothetical protein
MNIYAKEGHKVIVTKQGINSGYDHHKKTAKKYLRVGNIYTVEYTSVGGWHTDVYLKEIPNVAFNSVHFDDAES